MGNPRGVRRDFDALAKRRLSAVGLFKKELNNSDIGRRLKVPNQTVSRWRKQYGSGGREALKQAGRAGRKPGLDRTDLESLEELLLEGPQQLGYETPLWTCERVGHLIERQFEIQYHPGHVWKILRSLNWSPQRPAGRALERNEAAITQWKKKDWPDIKKKHKKSIARSSSSTKAD